MKAISQTTLKFLKDLSSNNNRDWFLTNKSRYEEAKEEFEKFMASLLLEITRFDSQIAHFTARDCIFRIYRDIRFSNDKSPYKTHFGAYVSSAARKSDFHSRAGYYIHIAPGTSMLARGAYQPDSSWLKGIRNEIAHDADGFRAIISAPNFKKYFGNLEGERLKTTPRDFPADHPEIDLLRYKSFLASHTCLDTQLIQPDFLDHATSTFRALYPFNQYLNEAFEPSS